MGLARPGDSIASSTSARISIQRVLVRQDLRAHALALAEQAEQDVLGADVVVLELQRLAQRQLEHLLRPRRKGDVTAGRRLAPTDNRLQLGPYVVTRVTEGVRLALASESDAASSPSSRCSVPM